MKSELPKPPNYIWKRFIDPDFQDADLTDTGGSKKNLAIIATSSGFIPSQTTDDWIKGRAKALKDVGCEIYVPQFIYSDGTSSLVFEKSHEIAHGKVGGSNNSTLIDRGVSAENGVKQIVECVEAGLDIFPFMGGMSFVDKTAAIIDHFNGSDAKKPEKPVRIFNFSDVSHAAFLQSHHPDIFRFYSTTSSRDLYLDKVSAAASCREEYDEIKKRNFDNLCKIIQEDAIDSYPRQTLFLPQRMEIDLKEVQYFPMHSDMIMADAIDFDIVRGGRGNLSAGENRFGKMLKPAYKLNTTKPYILGFESFLQQPSGSKEFDNNFGDYLDEFLQQRAKISQLPVAIEMGLFETRIDGDNGYADGAFRLHDENTGLIKVDSFNVDRLFVHKDKISKQIKQIIEAQSSQSSVIVDRERVVTQIPESVKAKVENDIELEKADIAAILEVENQKILERQNEIRQICEKYNIALIANHRHGHSLNQGVIGGGLVNVRIDERHAEVEQLPTDYRIKPFSRASSFSASNSSKEEGCCIVM